MSSKNIFKSAVKVIKESFSRKPTSGLWVFSYFLWVFSFFKANISCNNSVINEGLKENPVLLLRMFLFCNNKCPVLCNIDDFHNGLSVSLSEINQVISLSSLFFRAQAAMKPSSPASATSWYWGATSLPTSSTWPGAGGGGATFPLEHRSGTGCCGSCRCSRLIKDRTPARGGRDPLRLPYKNTIIFVCSQNFSNTIYYYLTFHELVI